jgi:hypothetical protein
MAYKHGTYGQIEKSAVVAAAQADSVLVCVGTAPIQKIAGRASLGLVNQPIRLRNMEDAKSTFGWSDDWAKFTLCEVFDEHFNNSVENVGPIYVINVLDPDTHKGTQVSLSNQDFTKTGVIYIADDLADVDSVRVTGKVLDTDYSVSFDAENNRVVVTALTSLTATETVTYYPVDASAVTDTTIIGTSGSGVSTGIQAIKKVYTKYKAVPNLLACPGFSEDPDVYTAMVAAVQKINGHWDAFAIADIPVESKESTEATVASYTASVTVPNLIEDSVEVWKGDGSAKATKTTDYTLAYVSDVLTVTMVNGGILYSEDKVIIKTTAAIGTKEAAIQWQTNHGYVSERSKVCWPQVKSGTGKTYHLSTVCAATMLRIDLANNSIPMESPSNKNIMAVAQYFGSTVNNEGYDDTESNDLNEVGITTACIFNGSWVLWGPHTAAYKYGTTMDPRVIFDTNIRMLMHVTNGFQLRHGIEIDAPMTPAQKDTVINAENAELDRLTALGALIGESSVEFLETENPNNDMLNGDFVFNISFTSTPPFKSGTAKVSYTDKGFAAFFGGE